MSIHLKKGKWYASVYLGVENGKEKREWSEGFTDKSLAKLKEIEIKKDVIERSHVVRKKESFVNVANSWFKSRKKTISQTTYKQNQWYYDHYILPKFKNYLVYKIDGQDILNFMSGLDVSPATINKAMNILKQILDLAVSFGYIKSNPCTGIKKPKIKQSKIPTWDQNDIKDFLGLDDVIKSTAYIAFCILFTTGMRPGEVCGLRWCDWHTEYFIPEIGIDKYRQYTNLKNEFAHQKVYIGLKLQSEIKNLKKYRKEYCISQGIKFDNESFINCFEPDLRPMTPDYLRKAMQRILDKNNIDKISPYSARHSFGTNMMINGINPKKVSEAMRHSSVRTTLDRYSHVDDATKKRTFNDYADGIM